MSAAGYRLVSNIIEGRDHIVRVVGGSSAATEVAGSEGVTITRTGAGRFTITWALVHDPGVFIGAVHSFQATTPGNVKNYVAVFEPYASRSIAVSMYESGTLTDLDALEWITCRLTFQQTKGIF